MTIFSSPLAGRIEKRHSNTLRWDPRTGRAFTSGGVAYQFEDGALRVNETGLFHVYSRVELIFKDCDQTSSFVHSVFVRREGAPLPMTLMEAHRASFCSQHPGRPWTTESYLGSALQLQKHDRVFVNVSQPNSVSHAHYANFFGLYKVWRVGGFCGVVILLQWKNVNCSGRSESYSPLCPDKSHVECRFDVTYNICTEKHNMKCNVKGAMCKNVMRSLYCVAEMFTKVPNPEL